MTQETAKTKQIPTKETAKTNTKPLVKRKRRKPMEGQEGIYSWRSIPVSLAMVEHIRTDLLAYPRENPEATTLTEFFAARNLSRSTYSDLMNRHPDLKEAHELTMRRLGERLYNQSVYFKANWNAVKFMLHNYGEEFKEAKELEAKLKATESSNQGIQIVQMPAIPKPKVEQ